MCSNCIPWAWMTTDMLIFCWPAQVACHRGERLLPFSHHFAQFCRDVKSAAQGSVTEYQQPGFYNFPCSWARLPPWPCTSLSLLSSPRRAPGSSLSLPAILPLLVPETSQLLLLPSGTAFPYLTASLPLCLCSNLYPFSLIYYYIIFLLPSVVTYFLIP